MSKSLPEDIQGCRVFFRGDIDDQGAVTKDLREERVEVAFDSGTTEWVARTDLTVIEDDDE